MASFPYAEAVEATPSLGNPPAKYDSAHCRDDKLEGWVDGEPDERA